jgi:dihydrofolate reductase
MKVIMMMAMTLDGKIAKSSDHFPDWTSKEDKKLFAKTSKEAGVVIMGDKTFFTFPAPLKDRLNVVFTLEENPGKANLLPAAHIHPANGNLMWFVDEPAAQLIRK